MSYIHLWCIEITPYLTYDPNHQLLNKIEFERYQAFHFEKHKKRFATSRKILRLLLGSYLSIEAKKIKIDTQLRGKPYLAGDPVYFNMSHSENYLLIGISDHLNLGVDVEVVKPRDFLGLAKRSFSEWEYNQIKSASPGNAIDFFYQIWSQKEALIKLDGRGLSFPLQSFSTIPEGDGGLHQPCLIHKKLAQVKSFKIWEDAFCAYALNQNIPHQRLILFNKDLDEHIR